MKPRSPNKPVSERAGKRAHQLIDRILKEMQAGLDDKTRLQNPEWERLFGTKQSMVANLQKLVQALMILPSDGTSKKGAAADVPLGFKELQLLAAWTEEDPADQ